eukprot:12925113-Prorocentrum_lima.AAC.1
MKLVMYKTPLYASREVQATGVPKELSRSGNRLAPPQPKPPNLSQNGYGGGVWWWVVVVVV